MVTKMLALGIPALAGIVGILTLALYQHVHHTTTMQIPEFGKAFLLRSNIAVAHNNASKPNMSKHLGYVLPLGYGGYQGRGCDGILSVQCWVKSFALPMLIVEPMIQGSQFVTYGNLRRESDVRAFSEIFDINNFNKFTAGKTGYAQLSTWEDFLQYSPKNVIYIRIRKMDPKHQGSTIQLDYEASSSDECSIKYSELKFLEKFKFCVVKTITSFLRKQTPFTADEMKSIIFNTFKPEEVTLVLSGWSPRNIVPNPKLPDPYSCLRTFFDEGQSPFAPSPLLMEAVKKYEHLYLTPQTSVAVMIRSEHFLRSIGGLVKQSDLLQTIDRHLEHLLTLAKELNDKFPDGKVFVTADVGTYGSFTWSQPVNALGKRDPHFYAHVENAVKKTVVSFHHKFQSFKQWEESFTNVTGKTKDQTFIAALQRAIASRAKCLLLFGGGSYELLAFRDYLRNNPDRSKQCWRCIDVRTNFKQSFLQQFQGMGHLNISSTSDLYKGNNEQ